MLGGEAGLHSDSVLFKLPEARASEAPFGKPPGGGVTGLDSKVLEVRDHGRDRPFDQGPSLWRLLQLAPSDLPEAAVLVGHGLREEELVQSAPVLQDHRPERVAAVAFPQAENNVDAAQFLSPTGLGGLGAEAWRRGLCGRRFVRAGIGAGCLWSKKGIFARTPVATRGPVSHALINPFGSSAIAASLEGGTKGETPYSAAKLLEWESTSS